MKRQAEENFKQNCHFFYSKNKDTYKTIREIKNSIKCQSTLGKKSRKLLYARREDKDEYDFISQQQIRDNLCISNYNKYLDPERKIKHHKKLNFKDLFSNCSTNTFSSINEDYEKLVKYSSELTEELKVDELIKQFINDLIIYTNINEKGLHELFNGAFIIIRDKGFFYNRFKCPGKARICNTKIFMAESSHDSLHKDQQYRLGNGILYNCDTTGSCNRNSTNSVFDLLLGTSPVEYFYGDTWIQFEYANLLTVWNKYGLHLYSYIKHKLSGQNVGPLGNSDYAEYTKPLILEICYPEVCETGDCNPIPCVRPKIDLDEYSESFLRENNISMQDYKNIKDFVKNYFSSTSEINLSSVNEKLIQDINDYENDVNLNLNYNPLENFYKKIAPYIEYLSTPNNNNNNNTYDREEIIEIMFLIFYYANQNNMDYDELTRKMNERYPSTKGGKRRKNKSRNNKKTKRNYLKIRNSK